MLSLAVVVGSSAVVSFVDSATLPAQSIDLNYSHNFGLISFHNLWQMSDN